MTACPAADKDRLPGTIYGYVDLVHKQHPGIHPSNENLKLYARFSTEPLYVDAPFLLTSLEPVREVETPDGVPCEFRSYQSGILPDDPDPPAPPKELDGGEIRAWADGNEQDALWVSFGGDSYDPAYRTPWDEATWPIWMSDLAITLQLETTGSTNATPFHRELILPTMPEILVPASDEVPPLQPDPDGTHEITWLTVEADRIEVTFSFGAMNSYTNHFRCYPELDQQSMRLPSVPTWVRQRHEAKLR